jgi:adenylate cyclase
MANEGSGSAAVQNRHDDDLRIERLTQLLSRFTTPEVASIVVAHPSARWRRCERRVVSVLFVDVRSFTAYAATVDPEDAAAVMNEIFSRVCEAVAQHGGMVNHFLGDGVLALFGAPDPLEDHARAAARAALRARDLIDALAESRHRDGLCPLRIGLAINTGALVAGCFGPRERLEYTVMGHTVNVAARLVAAAHAGQILVGQDTAQRLGAEFVTRDDGTTDLNGIGSTRRIELVQRAG